MIPLTIAVKLWSKSLSLPREPILEWEAALPSDKNEVQDLVVLLHRLASAATRRVAHLFTEVILPGTQSEEDLVVEVPANTSECISLRKRIQEPNQFLAYAAEKKGAAYVNGKGASGGDAFLLLKLEVPTMGCEWVVIIVQSKRKESLEERKKVDTAVLKDYNKSIWRRDIEQFMANKMFPVFLYLTDAEKLGV